MREELFREGSVCEISLVGGSPVSVGSKIKTKVVGGQRVRRSGAR